MTNLVYDFTNFKGLITQFSSTSGAMLQCNNYDAKLDDDSGATLFAGFLTKYPLCSTELGDTISTSISRGIYYFVPVDYAASGTLRYIQAFSDGTLRYLNSATWTTIASGFSSTCQFVFDSYNTTLFAANGYNAVYKWKTGWTSAIPIKDKGATAASITGNVTFTVNSTAVTGGGTAFDTELSPGDWIRVNSSATAWYEVLSVASATALTLNSEYLGSTETSAVAQKASNSTIRARFVISWKDRLFAASGDASTLPIVGEVRCDIDTTRPLP